MSILCIVVAANHLVWYEHIKNEQTKQPIWPYLTELLRRHVASFEIALHVYCIVLYKLPQFDVK